MQKNAKEKKPGAGQYFTMRPLIDAMVAVMKPPLDDIIQDPAAGTGGFLIAADKDDSDGSNDTLPEPPVLAVEAITELEAALGELRGILAELCEDLEEETAK